MKFIRKEKENYMEETNTYLYANKNYSDMNDEDLIKIIKSGDKDALDYLINKYKELVNI